MQRISTCLLFLASFNLHANVIQYFTGISYNNPSELFKVKDNELIFGGTGFYVDARFEGSVLNFTTGAPGQGVSHSRTTSLLPYGRIAKRINDKMVASIDVTQPFHSNLNWGVNSFTRFAATHNFLTDTDFSPKLAISLSKALHIGGGVNFNFLKNNEVNFAFPNGSTDSTVINRTSGFGVGYNLGMTLIATPTDFLGLTYYSRIKQDTAGYSRFGNTVSNNHTFSFYMPATTVGSYLHIFNQKWLTNIQVFHTQWEANQYVRLFNTAAPKKDFVFPMMFDNSWAFLGVVRQQYNEKLGLSLIGVMDTGPEQENLRSIVFPSDTQYFLALMGDYQLSKTTKLELIYGHGFSKTTINNRVVVNGTSLPFTTGRVRINADVIDLKLKIQV